MHTPLLPPCDRRTGGYARRGAGRGSGGNPALGPFANANRTILTTGGCGFDQLDEYVDKVRKAQRDFRNLPSGSP